MKKIQNPKSKIQNGEASERLFRSVDMRIAELSAQISDIRKELSGIARLLESKTASHEERLQGVESFRRWMVGLMTGVFLSGVAATLGWIVKG